MLGSGRVHTLLFRKKKKWSAAIFRVYPGYMKRSTFDGLLDWNAPGFDTDAGRQRGCIRQL